jgi:RNA polymerase sigma-70 factor (ECF subfamily)
MRVAAAHRRRAYHRREQTVGEVPEEATAEGSPEEAAASLQARARLAQILDLMDLEKRAIFVMFELDEVSCDEMAQVLGVPVGTVYSRLHAARKDFQAAVIRFNAREASRAASRRGSSA